MYKIGEFVVYGNDGICEVEEISKLNSPITNKMTEYYKLKPLHGNGNVLAPVDTNVFMRLAVTSKEIESIITDVPEIRETRYDIKNIRELQNHYKTLISSHEFVDTLRALISLNNKKEDLAQSNKKLGQVEEKFLRIAKDLVEDEFSVAFDITKQEAGIYISENIF
ncbi:MAG: CarD family transcriptional regulator [Peptostreptococcaceae bacterium]